MIEAHTWPTPNGRKLHIMLEETGLDYKIVQVNIGQGEQKSEAFQAISPNMKVPAIVDHDGPNGQKITVSESAAILVYLANKSGRFLPDLANDPAGHYRCLEWLMWSVAAVGPTLIQNTFYRRRAQEDVPYTKSLLAKEMDRLFAMADAQLSNSPYIAGDGYTIADISCYGFFRTHAFQGQAVDDYPSLQRWLNEIGDRPAVERGVAVLAEHANN